MRDSDTGIRTVDSDINGIVDSDFIRCISPPPLHPAFPPLFAAGVAEGDVALVALVRLPSRGRPMAEGLF